MKLLLHLILALILTTSVLIGKSRETASLRELFKEVKDSVVVIRTKGTGVGGSSGRQLVSLSNIGSGVIISEDGKIITAAHVVQTADEITVELFDGRVSDAYIIASSVPADLTLLKMVDDPAIGKPPVLGDSDLTEIGEQVFVVGAPYGVSHTLTVGHVSGRKEPAEAVGIFTKVQYLQTDAAINEGNSGGPMFNMRGEVIGICSHILSQGGGSEGIGFVATSNLAKKILLDKKTFWTGVDAYPVSGELARVLNVPQDFGIIVQRIADSSPADLMGLRAGTVEATVGGESFILGGDIILEVQGIQMSDTLEVAEELMATLAALEQSDMLTVKVLRGGEIVDLTTFVMREE